MKKKITHWSTLGLLGSLLAGTPPTAYAQSQPPAWTWAQGIGTSSDVRSQRVATDAAGNVIVTGVFREQARFGTTRLTSRGDSDMFVAKYSPAGALQWVRQAGAADPTYDLNPTLGEGVATDAAGNVYVTGDFHIEAVFDTVRLVNTRGNSTQQYLAKYSPQGTLL